jgi:hypothetical protein
MIWQPEFTDKTLSRKPGAVHNAVHYSISHFPTAKNCPEALRLKIVKATI